MHKVYLAGSITGLTYETSEAWRDYMKEQLADAPHIQLYSPLRAKEYLKNEGVLEDQYERTLFSTETAIMSRDFFDVSTSDALVANLSDANRVSIGTVMEIAWAYQKRIPVIIIGGNKFHNHSMLRQAANWWLDNHNTHEAALILRTLFTP